LVVGSRSDGSTSSPSPDGIGIIERQRGGLLTQPTGHQMRHGFHLRYLGDKGYPFCSPTVYKIVHERPGAVAWFAWSLATAVAAPSGVLAPRFALAVAVQVGAPPPSVKSM
jgi:hypothetical protein